MVKAMWLGLSVAMVAMAASMAAAEDVAPAISEIEGLAVKAGAVGGGSWDRPVVMKDLSRAGELFAEADVEKLKGRVDFAKQMVLVFFWHGSGGDRLTYAVAESYPEQVMFSLTPGRTKDLQGHLRVFALRSNVTWRVNDGRGAAAAAPADGDRPVASSDPVQPGTSTGSDGGEGGQKIGLPPMKILVTGGTAFACDLYGRLAAEEKGNLFFSPSSVRTALAMTYGGAAGKTAEEMAATLNFRSLPPERLHATYAEFLKKLTPPPARGDDPPPYQLHVANALWGGRDYPFRPEYLKLVDESYGAKLTNVDFSKPEAAAKTINDWVAEKTAGRIKNLVPASAIDPATTRLVLTNAIYFKSSWMEPFSERATKDGAFTTGDGKTVNVPLMNAQERFGYFENDELQVLRMWYQQNELSMIVLLPKKVDGLAEMEKSLTPANLQQWLSGIQPATVIVTLPKFTFESEFSLAGVLAAMGMTEAFGDSADFSGMTTAERLQISDVVHKAFIAVDEKGTEAAAATGVMMRALTAIEPEEPKRFNADHPFIFLIEHQATGEVLFAGRVVNPKP